MFTGFHFRAAHYLYLLTMVVPLALLFYWLIERRRQHFLGLMGEAMTARATGAVRYYRVRAGLLLLAVIFLILALARPQWGQYRELVQSQGVNVIIAVDVSLSMLADDEKPSRLARARRLSTDLVERLSNDRIGLIGFAGSSAALIPLTLDTAALKTFIDSLDGRAVDDPGTELDQAIRRATQSFKTIGRQSRVLIIISDGEDQSDEPSENVRDAALEAANNGVIIISVGVGTTKGSNIPLDSIGGSGYKTDADGKTVVTKLDESVLQTVAESSQGLYLHAQPDSSELAVIDKFIEKLNKGEFRDLIARDREERFQYPLAIAAILLISDLLLLLRRP